MRSFRQCKLVGVQPSRELRENNRNRWSNTHSTGTRAGARLSHSATVRCRQHVPARAFRSSEVPSTDAEHVWMLRSCDSTKVVILTSINVWIEYAERARLLVKLIVMQPRKPDLPSSRPRSGGKHENDLQFQDCEGSIEAEVRVRGIPMSTPMAPPETQAPGSIKVRIQIPVMDVDQTNLPCWCATQHLGGMVYGVEAHG